MQDLDSTLDGLADHVMERIPIPEQEGIQRALELLLVTLQAVVEHPALKDGPAALITLSQNTQR